MKDKTKLNSNHLYVGGYVSQPPIVDEAPKPRWSGLYDQNGIPLYNKPNPIGFCIDPKAYK